MQLRKSQAFLTSRYPDVEVIALWVDEEWRVNELDLNKKIEMP